MNCWSEDIFKNPDEIENFICPIGLGVLNDPMKDTHGHVFCKECIINSFRNSPVCPLSKTEIQNEVTFDLITNSKMFGFEVFCPNKELGCEWEGIFANLSSHFEDKCSFLEVKCKYKLCQMIKIKSEIEQHELTCVHQPIPCCHCQILIIPEELVDHHKNKCQLIAIPCPKNCQALVVRKNLPIHLAHNCKMLVEKCRFSNIGCTFSGRFEELASHMVSSAGCHINLFEQVKVNADFIQQKTNQLLAKITTKTCFVDKVMTSEEVDDLKEMIDQVKNAQTSNKKLIGCSFDISNAPKSLKFSDENSRVESDSETKNNVCFLKEKFRKNYSLIFSVLEPNDFSHDGYIFFGFANKGSLLENQFGGQFTDDLSHNFVGFTWKNKEVHIGYKPNSELVGLFCQNEESDFMKSLKVNCDEKIMIQYDGLAKKVIVQNVHNPGSRIEIDQEVDLNTWQPFFAMGLLSKINLVEMIEVLL